MCSVRVHRSGGGTEDAPAHVATSLVVSSPLSLPPLARDATQGDRNRHQALNIASSALRRALTDGEAESVREQRGGGGGAEESEEKEHEQEGSVDGETGGYPTVELAAAFAELSHLVPEDASPARGA